MQKCIVIVWKYDKPNYGYLWEVRVQMIISFFFAFLDIVQFWVFFKTITIIHC